MKFKKIIILSIAFFLVIASNSSAYESAEIKRMSVTMADKIIKAKKKTVAVTDFTDLQGNITQLGRFIAEHFSVALAGSGQGIEVIDRTHIKQLLKEHKLAEKGLIDTVTAKELGKIAGVDALITGTLTPFGNTVEMTIKVLDTETAKVIDAGAGSVAETATIKELLKKGINVVSPDAISDPIPEDLPGQQIVNIENIIFSLQGCKRKEQNVDCDLIITSQSKDVKVSVQGWGRGTRMFDDLGHEYGVKRVQVGNKMVDSYNTWIENLFIARIPTKAQIGFEGVALEAKKIALIDLKVWFGGEHHVTFRNVSF